MDDRTETYKADARRANIKLLQIRYVEAKTSRARFPIAREIRRVIEEHLSHLGDDGERTCYERASEIWTHIIIDLRHRIG